MKNVASRPPSTDAAAATAVPMQRPSKRPRLESREDSESIPINQKDHEDRMGASARPGPGALSPSNACVDVSKCILVVSQLPDIGSPETLKDIFTPFGEVRSFTPVEGNPTVAVVMFARPEAAEKALCMHGVDLGFGTPIHVQRPGNNVGVPEDANSTATETVHIASRPPTPSPSQTPQPAASGDKRNVASSPESIYPCIGIDLGTTYSCVGIWRNNSVEIIPNDFGNRTTPSYVCFSEDGGLIVGESAKSQAALHPTRTIFDAKRLIGRNFEDKVVQTDVKQWPFLVTGSSADGKTGPAVIKLQHRGKLRKMRPEEVSSLVLGKMRSIAETYLGCPVLHAVVTVPAYFTDAQRAATKAAGAIAGLKVMRIINEPTAAAIAYGLDKQHRRGERNVLVFDLGGGTFDVTLLALEHGVFEVRATAGDTHLGGEDFDNILVSHFVNEFKRRQKKAFEDAGDNVGPVKLSKRSLRKLRTACERAKRILSSEVSAPIEIESFHGGEDFASTLSRAKFENLCKGWFEKAIAPIAKVLEDAGMKKDDVHEIVLVGGSTRIPKIRSMLSSYFNGKELNKSINADEAVAFGAAVQGAILAGGAGRNASDANSDASGSSSTTSSTKSLLDGLLLLDVLPLSLGVETSGGVMTTLIPRNSTVPTRCTHYFTTAVDNQEAVTVQIYEGERRMTKDCHKLGEFTLENLPKMPRGVPQIEVVLSVDGDGILQVQAKETSVGGDGVEIEITNDRGQLSSEDIDKLVAEAEASRAEDEAVRAHAEARNALNELAYALNKNVVRDKDAFSQLEKTQQESLREAISDTADFIADLRDATDMTIKDKKDEMDSLQNRKNQLMNVAKPMLKTLGIAMSSSGGMSGALNLPADHCNGWQQGPRGVVVENVDG